MMVTSTIQSHNIFCFYFGYYIIIVFPPKWTVGGEGEGGGGGGEWLDGVFRGVLASISEGLSGGGGGS